MNIWLLSDPHFKHEMILAGKYRPEDYALKIHKACLKIPEEDLLICLGDVTLEDNEEVHEWIKKWKCKKILVKGNHDNKSNEWYLSHGWDFVCLDFFDILYGQKIIFTHQPITTPPETINIHGHLHARCHRENPNFKGSGCLLVSCELQGYAPQTLKSFLKKNRKIIEEKTKKL